MAKVIETNEQKTEFSKNISRLFQSGNINFILGSGASSPAISVAGNIESDIKTNLDNGNELKAFELTAKLLTEVQAPTNIWLKSPEQFTPTEKTKSTQVAKTLSSYKELIANIEDLLNARKNSLLAKQANIFTTNYDLFLEKASEEFQGIVFNDGFARTLNLKSQHAFSSRTFFNALYNKGNLYNYKVEVPAINIIKLHGSLSWKKYEESIQFECEVKQLKDNPTPDEIHSFNNSFSVVLPRKEKFKETIMDRTYYDLLRIFANEMDKEGTLLVSFGFSFLDEHIRDITLRSLKNPTLKLVAFAYDKAAVTSLKELFSGYSNVDIICPEENKTIAFDEFNRIVHEILNPPNNSESK